MYSKLIINFIQEEFKNSETIVEFDIQNETEFVLVLNNEKNSVFKFIEEKLTPEMNHGRTFSMKHIKHNSSNRFIILFNAKYEFILIDQWFNFAYDEYFNDMIKLIKRIQSN